MGMASRGTSVFAVRVIETLKDEDFPLAQQMVAMKRELPASIRPRDVCNFQVRSSTNIGAIDEIHKELARRNYKVCSVHKGPRGFVVYIHQTQ